MAAKQGEVMAIGFLKEGEVCVEKDDLKTAVVFGWGKQAVGEYPVRENRAGRVNPEVSILFIVYDGTNWNPED